MCALEIYLFIYECTLLTANHVKMQEIEHPGKRKNVGIKTRGQNYERKKWLH